MIKNIKTLTNMVTYNLITHLNKTPEAMEKKPTIVFAKTTMRVTVILAVLLIIFTSGTFAQVVRGRVTSSQGEGISGVTINLKGTTIGTTTDSAGKYEINRPNKGVLIFSHIGYLKQEIK